MSQKFIPLSVPNLKGRELEYVTEAVETEWVSTGGAFINDFEANISKYLGTQGAVACQNGTSGLHIALVLNDVGLGDEVIAPALTFIAAVNPIRYVGAEPVFMDCDDSLSMDPDKLQEFCENECDFIEGKLINKKTKKHIKALILVHVFGNLADIESIKSITDEYGIALIEDATEAIGSYYTSGKYNGKYAGTIGKVGVYSFNGNKIMTTAGGGMIVSTEDEFLKRAKHLTTQAKADELYFIHDEVGYNYRMNNIQAALGLGQLEQLETFIETKKRNYFLYKEAFSSVKGLKILDFKEDIRPNYWFYSLYIEDDYPINRDEMIKYLSENSIQARPIWGLINEQKPYLNNQVYKIEKAKTYLKHIVNIPCSTNLSEEDALYVVECIKKISK